MDFLDEYPERVFPNWVEAHLTTCPHCQNYASLSNRLRNLSLKNLALDHPIPSPTVRGRTHHPLRWAIAVAATVVIGLGVGVGLFSFRPASPVITLADTSSTVETTQTIDYYTEIALLW